MVTDKVSNSGEEENELQKLKSLFITMEAWLMAANKEKNERVRRKAQRRMDFYFAEVEAVLKARIRRGDIDINE
jgi:hypothetical protein